jgi:hypothetical protein
VLVDEDPFVLYFFDDVKVVELVVDEPMVPLLLLKKFISNGGATRAYAMQVPVTDFGN